MNLLDYSLSIFNRVISKEISFSQAMNKHVKLLNVDESDATKIKDVLKSVINRYYFFKWELESVITKENTKDEINILILSLAFARYARNVTSKDVMNWLKESIEENKYNIDFAKASKKISNIYSAPTIMDESLQSDICKKFALMFSYPEWLVKMWLKHYGPKNTIKTLSFSRTQTPISVSINSMKEEYDALNNDPDFEKSKLTTTGYTYIGKEKLNLNKFFINKDVFVLDQSQQYVIDVMEPFQGDNILMSTNEKTILPIAMDMRLYDFGKVVCVYPNINLVNQARNYAQIYQVKNIIPVESSLDLLITHLEYKSMDKVLCMPPSSDFGLIRRKPEILITFEKEDMDRLVVEQKKYIEELSKFVKEDGMFVYSVTTLNDKESRNIVKEFLTKHKEFTLEEENIIFPYQYQCDGIYYAKMIRRGENND